jgi:hypothetical protein
VILRGYLAQAMTNCYCDEMIDEAKDAIKKFAKYKIKLWSPVIEERIPYKHVKLTGTTKASLIAKWNMDKRDGLRGCHFLYIASGDMTSRGVGQERGHVRWFLWRPVIRKHQGKRYFSITDIEEDGAVRSHKEAAKYVHQRWNSRKKWILWKLRHILFGLPKIAWIQLSSLWL